MKKSMKEEKHESYGLIGISRIQSSHGINLFGSSMKYRNYLHLTIKRATKSRRHSTDWYHEEEDLIRIRLSPSQFAEMITNLNKGEGTPCTLAYVAGKRMEECPEVTTRQALQDDFKAQMSAISDKVSVMEKELKNILEKPTITKSDRAGLAHAVQQMRQEISSNLPFMRHCYEESVEKSVLEAKSEVEAYVAVRAKDSMAISSYSILNLE
jgi:hypothetical protein